MPLLSSEGEIRPTIVSSRVRPMCGKGYCSECATRVLERNGQASATVRGTT
jgi:ferredoxin